MTKPWFSALLVLGLTASLFAATTSLSDFSIIESCTDLTSPGMGNVTGTGIDSCPPSNAFDDNFGASDATTGRWLTKGSTAELVYTFEKATSVTHYTISSCAKHDYNGQTRSPKNFTLSGRNADTEEWIVLDERTLETEWGYAERRLYEISTPGVYTQYRFSVSANNGTDYVAIAELEFFNCSPLLYIEGFPQNFGTSSPAYGRYGSLAKAQAGEIIPVSIDASEGTTAETPFAYIGYSVFSRQSEEDEWTLSAEGTDATFDLVQTGTAMKLVWKFNISNTLTVDTSEGPSTVLPEGISGSHYSEEVITLTATPAPGWTFYKWIGNTEIKEPANPILSINCYKPTELRALFLPAGIATPVQYIDPNGDDANSGYLPDAPRQTMVAAMETLDSFREGTLFMNPGAYTNATTICLTNAIAVCGVSGNPNDVIITRLRNDGYLCRGFILGSPDARVQNITIENAKLNNNSTRGASFLVNEGSVSNCVARKAECSGYDTSGAGFAIMGNSSLVTHCRVEDCYIANDNPWAGNSAPVFIQKGRFENSMITGTTALSNFTNPKTVGGISIYADKTSITTVNPTIVNCTIYNCIGTATGGIYNGTGTARILNTVVAECTSAYYPNSTTNAWLSSAANAACFVACATDTDTAINDRCLTGNAGTFFRNADAGDFRSSIGLQGFGTLDLPFAIPDTDLAGRPRLANNKIDIGAFQSPSPSTFFLFF